MTGYALTWELNLAGPWGTAAWLVAGTALTIGMAGGVYKLEKPREQTATSDDVAAIPKTAEEPCKRYTVRVHAQGTDCGGTTASTIGAPAITQPTPVTVEQGLGSLRCDAINA